MLPTPLHAQRLTVAPAPTKVRLAVLASAMCDALGGPAEFQPRNLFDFIAHMVPNEGFGLPAGVWTDDTSMALALARSIATFQAEGGASERGGFDEADQLDAYYRWWQEGALSATGYCFDIGNTIARSLGVYRGLLRTAGADVPPPYRNDAIRQKEREVAVVALERIGAQYKGVVFGGNGSLMRVLPVGLAYYRRAEDGTKVGALAERSSAVTHPNPVCGEACAVWARAVARVVHSAANTEGMTKLDVLHHFAAYPYRTDALRQALAAEVPLPEGQDGDAAAMEAHYVAHHPVLRLVLRTYSQFESSGDDADAETRTLALLPLASELPSSGYVVHTLVAALYAFLAAPTFEAGALLVVNMGDDADTVAAVYGGLAGAWYAEEDAPGVGGGFWTPLVREWRDQLVRRDLVEEVTEELVAFAEKQQ